MQIVLKKFNIQSKIPQEYFFQDVHCLMGFVIGRKKQQEQQQKKNPTKTNVVKPDMHSLSV